MTAALRNVGTTAQPTAPSRVCRNGPTTAVGEGQEGMRKVAQHERG